jgi:hypothetical protein
MAAKLTEPLAGEEPVTERESGVVPVPPSGTVPVQHGAHSIPTPPRPHQASQPRGSVVFRSEAPAPLRPEACFEIAEACLRASDLPGAQDACARALAGEPANPDYLALSAWIRANFPGSDLRALSTEFDQILNLHERHLKARYYRALVRQGLGDTTGALRDLRRVRDLDPRFTDAARALAALEASLPKPGGFFARLFKRAPR